MKESYHQKKAPLSSLVNRTHPDEIPVSVDRHTLTAGVHRPRTAEVFVPLKFTEVESTRLEEHERAKDQMRDTMRDIAGKPLQTIHPSHISDAHSYVSTTHSHFAQNGPGAENLGTLNIPVQMAIFAETDGTEKTEHPQLLAQPPRIPVHSKPVTATYTSDYKGTFVPKEFNQEIDVDRDALNRSTRRLTSPSTKKFPGEVPNMYVTSNQGTYGNYIKPDSTGVEPRTAIMSSQYGGW